MSRGFHAKIYLKIFPKIYQLKSSLADLRLPVKTTSQRTLHYDEFLDTDTIATQDSVSLVFPAVGSAFIFAYHC